MSWWHNNPWLSWPSGYLYPNPTWYPPLQGGYQETQRPHRPDIPGGARLRMPTQRLPSPSPTDSMSSKTEEKQDKDDEASPRAASVQESQAGSEKRKDKESQQHAVQASDKAEKVTRKDHQDHTGQGRRRKKDREPQTGNQPSGSGTQRPVTPDRPPRKYENKNETPEYPPDLEENGMVECPACKKWVSSGGWSQHVLSNLIRLEKQSKREREGLEKCPKPQVVWHECPKCRPNQKWCNGAYGLKMHLLRKHGEPQDKRRGIELREAPTRRAQRSRTPSSRGGSHLSRSHPSPPRSQCSQGSKVVDTQPSEAPVQNPKTGEDRAEGLADLFEATSRVLRSHKKWEVDCQTLGSKRHKKEWTDCTKKGNR